MNYKAHAEKFKRFSKWGFAGNADEKGGGMTTQELMNQTRAQAPDTKCLHSSLGHKSSTSLDSRVFPTGTREPKPSSRPFSDFFPETTTGTPSNPGGTNRYLSVPKAYIDQATLAPQLSSALRNGPPKMTPIKIDFLTETQILDSGDDSLLRMLMVNTLAESELFGVIPPLELERMERESEALQIKISSLTTKLALEGKVMEAAQSLMRLHAANRKLADQAQVQLVAAQRKVDQVALELWKLHHRWWEIQRIQQEHHTAVLAMSYRHQQRELQRLRENMQLRLGQTAVADNSFINEEMPSVAQDKLTEALDTIQTQKVEIERLKMTHGGDQAELQENLEASHKRIMELEGHLTKHLSLCPKSSRSNENVLCLELDSIRDEHRQLLDSLELLYRDLPECEDEGAPFTIPTLLSRIDNLVGENHDLIDRVISLQKLHQDTEADRLEISQLKAQLEELRIATRAAPNSRMHLAKGSTLQAELAAILEGLGVAAKKAKVLHKSKVVPCSVQTACLQVKQDSASPLSKCRELQAEILQAPSSLSKDSTSLPTPAPSFRPDPNSGTSVLPMSIEPAPLVA